MNQAEKELNHVTQIYVSLNVDWANNQQLLATTKKKSCCDVKLRRGITRITVGRSQTWYLGQIAASTFRFNALSGLSQNWLDQFICKVGIRENSRKSKQTGYENISVQKIKTADLRFFESIWVAKWHTCRWPLCPSIPRVVLFFRFLATRSSLFQFDVT